jgi:DNA-binding NarL/FixJ family response regulator
MIDVVIVEDNDAIREGLAALISGTEGYRCVGAFAECESMIPRLDTLVPDIVLMDIGLPGMSGIEGIKRIRAIQPEVEVLMLTIYEDNDRIFEALCAGASGYLVKKTPPARLLEAIKEVYQGGSPMSSQIARKVVTLFREQKTSVGFYADGEVLKNRELEILQKLVDGKTYQAIALDLYISIDTVRFHIRNIYKKLQVHSGSEAVAKALRKGLV